MGFFANLFSSKKKEEFLPELDMSFLKTDLHSHLLPGIDDGSQSMDDTLSMVRGLKEMGYSKIITTPHVMNDYYRNTPAIINSKLEEVQRAINAAGIDMTIEAAAEYLVDDVLEDKIKNNEILTFGKSNYVLIELPFFNPPQNLNSVIFNLEVNGYKVVLAHPERYLYWENDLNKFKDLKEREVLFQSNLLSFTNYYSSETRHLLEKLILLDMVDFVGSDLHQSKYVDYTRAALTSSTLHRLVQSGRLLNASL